MKAEVEVSKDIAKALLEVKAVFLRPDDMFTWASGIKSLFTVIIELLYLILKSEI